MTTWTVIFKSTGSKGQTSLFVYQQDAETSKAAVALALARIKRERGGERWTYVPIGVAFGEDIVKAVTAEYHITPDNLESV